MKKIIIGFILCMAMFVTVSFVGTPKVYSASASNQNDTLNYLSLGDSIAEGTGLEGFEHKQETAFVEGSYAYLFKNYLATRYSNINAISYAKSGDDSADLLLKLQNNVALRQSVENADIISICIGANDILGPATNNIGDLIINGTDISPKLQEGLNNFTQNFPQIVNLLHELNPNAVKIFTNVYNPFRELMSAQSDVLLDAGFFDITFPKERIRQIGIMAEDFIGGNEEKFSLDPTISRIYGLNERMMGILNGKDVERSEPIDVAVGNCYLIDSKKLYDNYSGSEKLVNANLLDQPNNTIKVNISSIVSDLYSFIDPHPTVRGHEIIYSNFANKFSDFAVVNYDYNGGTVNEKSNHVLINAKGSKLVAPLVEAQPIKSGYKFVDWRHVVLGGALLPWDFNSSIESDLTLIANWVGIFVINFNTVGGNPIESQSLNEGQKVVKPANPIKALSTDVFGGWYYLDTNNEKIFWDFENDVVTKNLTLIAKWVNLNCNNNNYLVQKINDRKPIVFSIDIDTTVQWYVDNKLQSNVAGNEFVYTPPEKAGSYKVYCVVNGGASKEYVVLVNHIVPTNINAELKEVTDTNLYTFVIEDGKFIDPSKVVWYATIDQFTDEVKQIGEGITCRARIANKCKVYAVYGEDVCVSKAIEVDPPIVIDNTSYIIISVALAIMLFVCLLTLVSRKKYKTHY